MLNIQKFWNGLRIVAKAVLSSDTKGELEVLDSDGKLQYHNGTTRSPVVTESHTATITNKTVNADNNTITDLEVDNLKSGVLNTSTTLASASNTQLPSALAVKTYIDDKTAAQNDASEITFTPTGSISSTNVQNAVAEVDTDVQNHISDTSDAHDASAISITAISTISATDVQGALAELQNDVSTVGSDLGAHIVDSSDAHDASAISVVPTGNLAASDVQAALQELQGDADAASTHIAASTNVHGLSGGAAVVGTTSSQTLTNKTVTGADIRTPVRSDVKQDTKANLVTYALTASNGQLCFATDTKEMFQVVDSTLKTVGGGGVANINALLTQTFDASALSDFTQTGLELVTANMINGAQSARLIHQAGSSRSFKQTISVDRKYRSEPVQLSLQVRSSASNGNLTLLVTDETNAATIAASQSISTASQIIASLVTNATTTVSGFSNSAINGLSVGMTVTGSGIPTGTLVSAVNTAALTITLSQAATASATVSLSFSALPDRRVFSFTIPASCASMSYTITALQEANAPESYIDDVVIELASTALLSTSVDVPNLTAWQGYTPTFQGFGTPTAVEFEWRQVGEDVEIRGKFVSGTSTAVEARIGLPGGLTSAGTGLIPSLQPIGVYAGNIATAANAANDVTVLIEPSVTYVTFRTPGTSALSKSNANAIAGLGIPFSFFAKVPCAGLSAISTKTIPLTQSGLIQNSDSVLRAIGSAGQSVTALVTDIPFSTVQLSSGADIQFNGSSFTALSSGIYLIEGCIDFGGSLTRTVELYVNGVSYRRISDVTSANDKQTFSYSDFFVAGSVVSIRVGSNGGTLENSISNASHYLTVTKQSSLKQVTVNPNSKITIPTSELRFEGASTRGSTATAIVRFDSVAKIRGDAFTVVSDAVNGTAITMTKAGRLAVASSFAANISTIYISRNQAVLTAIPTGTESLAAQSIDSNGNFASLSAQFDVNVGDVIRISCSQAPSSNVNNNLNLSFQEQDIAVSVSNVLPQFSESDNVFRGLNNSGQAITNLVTDIPFTATGTDTLSSWDGDQYTIKEDGIYSFTGNTTFTATLSRVIDLYVDGVFYRRTGTITSDVNHNFSYSDYFTKGQIISFRTGGTGGTLLAGTGHYLTAVKVGKPNVTGVNVTPFVNVPQPEKQFSTLVVPGALTGTITGSLQRDSSNGIYTYSPSTGVFTALKKCQVTVTFTGSTVNTTAPIPTVTLGSYAYATTPGSLASRRFIVTASDQIEAGGTWFASAGGGGGTQDHTITVVAEAASDQIITASESFSTDTASLQYAGSGAYTLTTLANAPVGTFITFTYAINTNTRTQTTTAPTQTTADMNTNGIQLYTRAYNAASTAAQPAAIAIQIGKGLKGRTLDLYKSAGKVTGGAIDFYQSGNTTVLGFRWKDYNESTGVLYLDAGGGQPSATTSALFEFNDQTAQTNGYLVINASRSPALVGVPLLQPRIATLSDVKASGTAGGSATAGSYQTRTLNTLSDPTGIVTSLASNQFTLPAGEYYIEATAPLSSSGASNPDTCKARIQNITDSTTAILGTSSRNANTGITQLSTTIHCPVSGVVVLSASRTFELQHRVGTTATNAFGQPTSFGDNEVYSIVKITRVK